MENTRKISAGYVITVLVLIAASLLGLAGINSVTAPIIEANSASEQFGLLYAVMPDAAGFNELELAEVPETVKGVFAESTGAGYALLLSTTQGYTGEPIEFTLAVDGEGKIAGVELTNYPETRDFGEEYPLTYLGQDSALADVSLVASVTYSSSAFRNAVADGLGVLVANSLIAEGFKEDSQILEEMIPVVYPGMANLSGISQYEEEEFAEGQYTYIQRVLRSANEAGYAYFVNDGENNYLAICNAYGGVKVFDTSGNDVSGEADMADIVAEVTADAASKLEVPEKPAKRLRNMYSEDATVTVIPLPDVYNSVTEAYLVEDGGNTYYGFVAASYGYNNLPMEVFFLLDDTGAIVGMNAKELIFFEEYFTSYELEEDSYKAGFQGLTKDTWTGDEALISGATFSTEGVRVATDDVFETFEFLTNGGQNNG